MIQPARVLCLFAVVQAVWLMLCAGALAEEPTHAKAAEVAFDAPSIEFFEKQVRPILVQRCYECHSAQSKEPKGGLRLDSRAASIQGGDTGPAVVPGDLKESLLVDAIETNELYEMPPKGKLPAEEIEVLKRWVREGAPWPHETVAASEAALETFDLQERAKHWCFQPVKRAEPPAVNNAAWPRTAVDRFILARLEQAGLAPAAEADKRTLLRRVTYDLIGLPPSPEEIDAFLADDSPQAYERVVERLLASPHYGERWARHWLDLVRFSETYGHEFDRDIPNAFRYRDYVIRALNDDLPYDHFVTEHIAGDLLAVPRYNSEGVNQSILATGFYFFGESTHSPVDVRQDEANRIDNQIDVLSRTLLGLTVACARCHDHKFDAITTKDYYALAGFMQSSRYQQAFIEHPASQAEALQKLEAIRSERARVASDFAKSIGQSQLVDADKASATKLPAALFEFTAQAFGDWFVTGDAFGARPAHEESAAGLLARPAAHSGLLSAKLQGAIRSPTFTIDKKKLFYRVYGSSGEVRLIVDGLQLIQEPIYGGLKFSPTGETPRWHAQDVSKWVGHRAYIEVLDDGDGYVALEQVVMADDPPPDGKESGGRISDGLRAPQSRDPKFEDAWENFTAKLDELQKRRETIEWTLQAPRRAPAIADGTPENEFVFIRGNHRALGDEVPRRFLEVLDGRPVTSGSGRLELAQRLTDPANPLVARVMVNRLWKHHFGHGIVRSVDDFGLMGQPPTHPELLDYLASEFVQQGWSIKQMHRLMVLSSAYRMSSSGEPRADEADPENKLVHQMNVRRLEAEPIRDALLAVSGRLDRSMFGPSVAPHLTPFMLGRGRPEHSGPLDGDGRRSIYLMVRRNFLSPMFLAFDYPLPAATMGRRSVSNVPAQALVMMNNPLVLEQAKLWAQRVLAQPGQSTAERISRMYVAAFGRPPQPDELSNAIAFLDNQATEQGSSLESPQVWTELAHVLFNLKEFIFIQ